LAILQSELFERDGWEGDEEEEEERL